MNSIDRYFQIMDERPEQFVNNGPITIVKDRGLIEEFTRRTGLDLGVLHESQFNLFIADLVRNGDGPVYRYERLVPLNKQNSVVGIPVNDEGIVLMRQYRHALRGYQICFPRGYSEPGMDTEENVVKEIREELGAEVSETRLLGTVCADSGICGVRTDVYLCRINECRITEGYEGICEIRTVSPEMLEELIGSSMIDDSFTLSAYALLKNTPDALKGIVRKN